MLRNMEYVYEVYKQGSFTKAAKSLYVSQPCLSALVKKTEEMCIRDSWKRWQSCRRPC